MNELLEQGLSVMGIGMGTVLFFLCIMIFSMMIMSKAVLYLNKKFPEFVPQTSGAKNVTNDDSNIALAVVAALASKK